MPTLSLGFTYSDRIRPLLDGRVRIAGYDLEITCLGAQELFRRTLQDRAFDVAELSMASHIAVTSRCQSAYVGIPAFLSRAFRHGSVFVRTDRGIETPADLDGRRIGLVEFQQTAAVWMRGILADDFGVAPQSVSWITAGLTQPQLTDRFPLALAPDIDIERSERSLDELLLTGAIDAVIAPTPPPCATSGAAPVRRLFPDYRAEEIAWHRRTGFFPIMHTAVLRRSLAEADPELPGLLFDALACAKRIAFEDLFAGTPAVMLPWAAWHVTEARETLGNKYWSYGAPANRTELDAMIRYACRDGVCAGPMRAEDLFWPSTVSLEDQQDPLTT